MSQEPVRMDFAKYAQEMKAQITEEVDAMENQLDEKELRRLDIPREFWGARFTDFKPTDLVGLAGDPIDPGEPRSLYIQGANGTGKSHLAACFAKAWRARWVDAIDVVVAARLYASAALLEYLERLEDCATLVIDDITAINPSEYSLTLLLKIVNKRGRNQRNTIVTTYHMLKEFHNVDPSLASRLSGYERIKLLGEDRRFQARGRTAPEAPSGT